jgi:hypothetical protein
MRFLFDPLREKEQKLERFRQSFRILTSDGEYPPERQNRLFHSCRKAGLDWDEARQYVLPDAVSFLRTVVTKAVQDKSITAEEVANIRRLQKRLLIPEELAHPIIEQFFDLIERKLTAIIIDQAAYLGEASVVYALKSEIAKYDLPVPRAERLVLQRELRNERKRGS